MELKEGRCLETWRGNENGMAKKAEALTGLLEGTWVLLRHWLGIWSR